MAMFTNMYKDERCVSTTFVRASGGALNTGAMMSVWTPNFQKFKDVCVTGYAAAPRRMGDIVFATGLTMTIDNRAGIRKLKITTSSSDDAATEKVTFRDTRLNIDRFNNICIACMSAMKPPTVPATPPRATAQFAAPPGARAPATPAKAQSAKRKIAAPDVDEATRAGFRPLSRTDSI